MIITVDEARQLNNFSFIDQGLEIRLKALESMVRKYTNNNFQQRAFRGIGRINDGLLRCEPMLFKVGDTVQISASKYNDGLVYIDSLEDGTIHLENATDEEGVIVTKVVYPDDVKLGVANLLKWEIENRDKVGIASESISRHSVTYFNMDGDNSTAGYPRSLLGFLEPYMKARF